MLTRMIRRAVVLALALLPAVACGGETPEPVRPAPPPPVASSPRPPALPDEPPNPYGYPHTRVAEVTDVVHGVKIVDKYRWLEDEKSPEVKAWLAEQDAFARARLAKLPDRDAIAARLREVYYVEGHGTPERGGKRMFYSKRAATSEKWVVYWREGKVKPGSTDGEKVLLDPNAWSKDGSVSLGGWEPSHDGQRVAYSVKQNNSDEATLHVMDVATGKKSDIDVIEGAKYAHASWTPRGDGFVYTWLPTDPKIPTSERPGYAEVRFHKLGTEPKKDVVLHPKLGDPKTFLHGELSRDGRYLLVQISHGWASTDVYFRDLGKTPLSSPKTGDAARETYTPLVVGKPFKYSVGAHKGRFYVKTDDGAPLGHIFRVDPAKPARDAWQEIVPESKATLEAFSIVGNRLSLEYLEDVKSKLEVRELDGKMVREIPLPAPGTASVVSGHEEDDVGYYSFTSLAHPYEIHEISMRTGKTSLFYRTQLPVDTSKLEVEQRFASSKDGTRVPFFLVKPKGLVLDGRAKTLVWGYGGFMGTQKSRFTNTIVPWIERGGVYVVANMRGGAEYGEPWHQAGMRHKKQNVFDDFYAVLEQLVKDRVTTPANIAIRGGSNGGLLVAAAITQRPELFRVGLCGVPLVDMVRYHMFGSGKTWIEEYGSADDAEDFKAIHAYSPYQHVTPGKKYPSLLVLSADNDDRVHPLHAWKFAALMQASSAGGPVLLRIEKNSGHGGADLVRATVEKLADELAFALGEMKKEDRP